LVSNLHDYGESHAIGLFVIKQAHIGMIFLGRVGVAVANFDMQLTGPTNLGGRGKRKCHIPHFPLTLGQYRAAVAVTCRPTLADLIANALLFGVCNSAFFKTGGTPNLHHAACLIAGGRIKRTDALAPPNRRKRGA
jgi:hypothetical protein